MLTEELVTKIRRSLTIDLRFFFFLLLKENVTISFSTFFKSKRVILSLT